jgi:uncharacterized membrane protein YozB (DUF420 family)
LSLSSTEKSLIDDEFLDPIILTEGERNILLSYFWEISISANVVDSVSDLLKYSINISDKNRANVLLGCEYGFRQHGILDCAMEYVSIIGFNAISKGNVNKHMNFMKSTSATNVFELICKQIKIAVNRTISLILSKF